MSNIQGQMNRGQGGHPHFPVHRRNLSPPPFSDPLLRLWYKGHTNRAIELLYNYIGFLVTQSLSLSLSLSLSHTHTHTHFFLFVFPLILQKTFCMKFCIQIWLFAVLIWLETGAPWLLHMLTLTCNVRYKLQEFKR